MSPAYAPGLIGLSLYILKFDMNDNEKTFTRELVRKAHVSPILLNAVLALSSRHLATISSFDSKKADQYSEKCVGEMICCLASRVDSMNDELFAATIILRTKEEMDGKLIFIQYSHLIKSHIPRWDSLYMWWQLLI